MLDVYSACFVKKNCNGLFLCIFWIGCNVAYDFYFQNKTAIFGVSDTNILNKLNNIQIQMVHAQSQTMF